MSLRIELLNTGSELLLGSVRDAHLSWFGRNLFPLGLRIARQTTVPDGAVLRDVMREIFPRTDLLIVTGGLGPTTDDITRETTAELTGRRLLLHTETLGRIHERCRRRGFAFQERMARQAMVPEGASVLPNENGTAPGLHLPSGEGFPDIFLFPGPPRELQPMALSHLIPYLDGKTSPETRPECRVYRIIGMGESTLEARIGLELSRRGDVEVGYCARPNEVDFRLIGPKSLLDELEPSVLDAVGDHLLPGKDDSMEGCVLRLLRERGATLTTAESCTGGLLADRITDVPGASAVFLQGYVAYSNHSKISLLGVPSDLISSHGAVSEEVVLAMARGAPERSGASHALATTGIAGPDGGTPEKPVGTVWMSLVVRGEKPLAWKQSFPLDRKSFKRAVTQSAFDRLRQHLKKSSAQ
jgi:nicotinamide-nucleotide amidase